MIEPVHCFPRAFCFLAREVEEWGEATRSARTALVPDGTRCSAYSGMVWDNNTVLCVTWYELHGCSSLQCKKLRTALFSFRSPFLNRSPILGTKYLELEWLYPQNGTTAVLKKLVQRFWGFGGNFGSFNLNRRTEKKRPVVNCRESNRAKEKIPTLKNHGAKKIFCVKI